MGFDDVAPATNAAVRQNRPPAPHELAPLFPELEILELVGQGGMGVVYRARQRDLDRIVALKILRPDFGHDSSFAERFMREGRALAQLDHPNIITVHHIGHRDDVYFLIMEYVDGADLRHLQRAAKLSPDETLALVPPICEALQYAHEKGIVHRDIKPENILLTQTGRVKIADFGLAKLADADFSSSLTGTHQVMGTPHYMAPEQYERPQEVDHRADIYSLGVVIYELLTGELPLGRFSLPSDTPNVDVNLDDVVMRSLEKKPDRRFQRASEFQAAIEQASTASGPHEPHESTERHAESRQGKERLRSVRNEVHGLMQTAAQKVRTIDWRGLWAELANRTRAAFVFCRDHRGELWQLARQQVARLWTLLRTVRTGTVLAGLLAYTVILVASVVVAMSLWSPPILHIHDQTVQQVVPRDGSFESFSVYLSREAELPRFAPTADTIFTRQAVLSVQGFASRDDEIPPTSTLRVFFDRERTTAEVDMHVVGPSKRLPLKTFRTLPRQPLSRAVVDKWLGNVGVDLEKAGLSREALWKLIIGIGEEPSGVIRFGDPPFRTQLVAKIDREVFAVTQSGFLFYRQYRFGSFGDLIIVIAMLFACHAVLVFIAMAIAFFFFRPQQGRKPDEQQAVRQRHQRIPLRLLSGISFLASGALILWTVVFWQIDQRADLGTPPLVLQAAVVVALASTGIGGVCHRAATERQRWWKPIALLAALTAMLLPLLHLLTFPYAFWCVCTLLLRRPKQELGQTIPP